MVKFHKKKRIISFDLDMTLLDHRTWEIPASAMEAIRRLREDSVIVVASGRNMNEPYSVAYRDMVKPDAIIHLNGTRVEVEGGKIIFEHLMDKERLRRLLAFGEEQKLALGISVDGGDYYTCPEDVVYYDKVRWGSSERNFKDPWLLMDMPVKTARRGQSGWSGSLRSSNSPCSQGLWGRTWWSGRHPRPTGLCGCANITGSRRNRRWPSETV